MKRIIVGLSLLLALLLLIPGALADEELHPGLMTITSGQSVGDGSYINHDDSGYPFIMNFELSEETIPLKSCRLGIYSWDCDELSTSSTREYDMVFVNGTMVGVLTGQDDTWKTSYMNVPIELLQVGNNTITIYVGHQVKATGEIVQNSSKWLLTVQWASLQFDDGSSENAPSNFNVDISYAVATPTGVECGATVTIETEEERSYVIEYSLVDLNEDSPEYNQIVADDSESVSGTYITSLGQLYLGMDPPMGEYRVEATLRDSTTNQVLAFDVKSFTLSDVLDSSCDHEPMHAQNTYRRTAYRMLAKDDERFDAGHEERDISTNTCSLCGQIYEIAGEWGYAAHTGRICLCGYVEPGYNPIHSATFGAVSAAKVNEDFIITVVVDEAVKDLTAVNNNDHPMAKSWSKVNNGDGTVTWTVIYTATSPCTNRSWHISAYNANGHDLGSLDTNGLSITENAPAKEPQKEVTGTYTVQVLDAEKGTPIEGASIALYGATAKTGKDGKAVFQRSALKGASQLLITASGYPDYDVSEYILNDMGYDVAQVSKQKGVILPKTCNGDSINGKTAQLNAKATHLTARIIVGGISHNEIVKYELLQNGQVLSTSATGILTLPNEDLTAGAPIVCRMHTRDVNGKTYQVEQALQIDVVSQGLLEIDLPFVDGVSFDLAQTLPLLDIGSLKFGNDKSKTNATDDIKGDLGNTSMMIGFGTGVEKDLTKLNNTLKDRHLKQGNKVRGKDSSMEVAMVFIGEFDKTGFTDCKVKASLTGSWSKSISKQFMLWIVPVVGKIEGKVSFGGYIEDDVAKDLSNMTFPAIGIEGDGSITGKVGAGCELISGGFYGTIGAGIDGSLVISPLKVTGELTLSGEFGLYGEVGVWPVKYEGKIKLLPENGKFTPIKIGENRLDRRYNARELLAQGRLLAANGSVSDVGYSSGSLTNLEGLPELSADPQIVTTGSVTLMAYLRENEGDPNNAVRAAWRILENGAWSAPRWVDASGQAGSALTLYQQGGDVYLAVSQLNRLLTAEDLPTASSLEEMLAQSRDVMGCYEIVLYRYDAAADAFVTVSAVTADASYDTMPAVLAHDGKLYVAWVRNTGNDILLLNGQNQVMLAVCENGVWTTSALLNDTPFVARLSLGVLDGAVCAAVVQHPNNDLTSMTDRTLTLVRTDGTTTLMDQGECDSPAFVTLGGKQTLTWYCDEEIRKAEAFGGARSVLLTADYMAGADYRIVSGQDRTMLLYTLVFTEEDGVSGRDVCGLTLEPTLTDPIRLTENGAYVDVFDAAMLPGGLEIVMIRTGVTFSENDFDSRFMLCAASGAFAGKLALDTLYADAATLLPGSDVTVTARLVATGTEPVSQITLTIPELDVQEQALAVAIPSGGDAEVSFDLTIPEDYQGTELTLLFTGNGCAPVQQTLTVQHCNVSLGAQSMSIAGAQHLVYAIGNNSRDAHTVTMTIRLNDAEGEAVLTKEFTLAAHEVVNDFMNVEDLLAKLPASSSELYVALSVPADDCIPEDDAVRVTFYK